MIDVVEWPATTVPAGSYEDPERLVGRVIKTPMVVGEPFVDGRLAPREGGAGLAAMIPAARRAMTVRVNEASGVAGFVHPGDLVDVIATMSPDKDMTDLRARIVLQNIGVLAVGQQLQTGSANPVNVPVVTLLVTPEESERLALATIHGDLQLTMRSGLDRQQVPTLGVSPPELYKIEGAADEKRAVAAGAATGATVAAAAKEQARRRRPSSESATRPPPAATPEAEPVRAAPPAEDVVEIIRGTRTEQRKIRPASGSSRGVR
jgi:pilus assembly protein CpaB